MKTSFVNITVSKLIGHYEKKQVLFNHPIQRKGGQWDLLGKSLLLHSILDDFPVPAIYSTVDKIENENNNNKPVTIFQVIDGKQRLLNIFDFINGEYPLHDETPDVETDDGETKIGGLFFNDLQKELKEKIKGFSFVHYKVEEATDDEIEEMFFRLNNGVALSKDQKTKAKLGIVLAKKVDEYLESDFIKGCTFTASQLRKADDMAAVIQGIMLVDDYDYISFSADEVMNFAIKKRDEHRQNIGENTETDGSSELDNTLSKVTEVLEYLSKLSAEIALIEDEKRTKRIRKYLKKINIPMLIKTAEAAIEKEISTTAFLAWYEKFFSKYQPGGFYGRYCSAGSIKRENVTGRVKTMLGDFYEYVREITPAQNGDSEFENEQQGNELGEQTQEANNKEITDENAGDVAHQNAGKTEATGTEEENNESESNNVISVF